MYYDSVLLYTFNCFRYFLWLWLVFEKPSKHPHIAGKELTYIEQSLGTAAQAAMPGFWNTPWKAFATSAPVSTTLSNAVTLRW